MNKEDDELVIELDDDEIDVDAATREALEAVDRVEQGAGPGEDPPAKASPDTEASTQLAAWREEALRARADYENLMRRSEREREENRKYLLSSTFRDLLPVVDNLGRALAASGTIEDLKLGVGLIHRQLLDLLKVYNVRPVESVGRPFDPAVHEAVARVEDAGVTVATVSEELQTGFMIGDRLLRPAMVKVAMPLSGANDAEAANESDDVTS
jgi:molecular chaperone GrpE